MNIPIDEMLTELRYALIVFENTPCADTLDNVFKETNRIDFYCEDIYVGADE